MQIPVWGPGSGNPLEGVPVQQEALGVRAGVQQQVDGLDVSRVEAEDEAPLADLVGAAAEDGEVGVDQRAAEDLVGPRRLETAVLLEGDALRIPDRVLAEVGSFQMEAVDGREPLPVPFALEVLAVPRQLERRPLE